MLRSVVAGKIIKTLFWYALLILTALGSDYVLHRLGLYSIGRYFGIVGTVLILVSLTYSLRKRKVIAMGSPKFLLGMHEGLSWAGALMLLVHAGVHFNALLPWAALGLLLVVVASGFVGRLLLADARAAMSQRAASLAEQGLAAPEIEKRLLLDAVAVGAMNRWRRVHMPLTTILAALTLLHIASVLAYSRWP